MSSLKVAKQKSKLFKYLIRLAKHVSRDQLSWVMFELYDFVGNHVKFLWKPIYK